MNLAHNIPVNIGEEDYLVYSNGRRREWNAKEVKKMLRNNVSEQGSRGPMWFSKRVPRFSFVAWTTSLNRLPKTDRLCSWGMNANEECVLCKSQNESRDHLFFECHFATEIWCEGVRRTCIKLGSNNWNDIIQQLRLYRGRKDWRV